MPAETQSDTHAHTRARREREKEKKRERERERETVHLQAGHRVDLALDVGDVDVALALSLLLPPSHSNHTVRDEYARMSAQSVP